MWAEYYRPCTSRELVGQELALANLKAFVKSFKSESKRAVLIYGPSGCGKNSLVKIVAAELGYDVLEFNASQFRDAHIIKEILKPATQQQSLFGKGNIILIDEAESFTKLDRGGLAGIIALLQETKWPIVFAANNLWDKKLNELRRKVQQIELKKLDYKDVSKVLRKICKKENLSLSQELIEKIAIKARGDIRAGINDLQSMAYLSDADTNEKLIETLGEREKEESIFTALSAIFKGKEARASLEVFNNVNLPLDECLLWLDENLPLEYQGEELEQAYKALSRADVFRRRIMRQQYWRFLVYVNALATAGVTAAKTQDKKGYVSYKRLSRLLKIWMAKQKNLKRKAIAEKLARAMHCSKKKAYKELPLFELIFSNSEDAGSFCKELRFSPEEMEYVQNLRKV